MHLIKNGTIVTPLSQYKADVLIKDGCIQSIGENLCCDYALIIDASDKYVLPGGIDVHTHMALPFGGTVSSDDFEYGTKAAAFGGITTIVDFAIQAKGQSLTETISKRRAEADNKVCIDYGLHLAITDLTPSVMEEIVTTIDYGCPTFKLFMTYSFAVDDFTLFHALKKAQENGGMISVHAENLNMITRNTKMLLDKGCTAPIYHAESRPDYVEAEAISRATMWAEETGASLYVVHLSSAKGLDKIRESRSRGGKILCETCPQYLILSKDNYLEENFGGAKYVMSPPLREKHNNEILWNGLNSGDIQIIGSDHCPFTLADKNMGIGSFDKIPNGAPGVETSMMLLYSEGVLKNRISINKMVEVLSFNPAKIFGLNTKGAIEVGKDADIVIFDPQAKKTLSHKTLHTQNDYSPYEGMDITGIPLVTMSRGKVVCNNGKFTGDTTWGKFISRKLN